MKDPLFWTRVVAVFETDKVQEIADSVGISYQSVRNWKLGELPGINMLMQIAALRNVSIHYLLTGEGPRSRSQLVDSLLAGNIVDNTLGIRVYLIERLSELVEGKGSEEVIRYLIGELARLNGEPERHEAKRKEKQ